MDIYQIREKNIRKTWLLMGIFLLIIVFLGWSFYQVYDNIWILYGSFLIAILMEVASFWFSDKISLSLSGAKPVTKREYPMLYNIVENLSITAGIPMPKVYVIQDDAPNAFATGRDPNHSAVAVTTGLLARLDKSELEGVIAHELSHIQNRDILVMSVAVVLVGFIYIFSDMAMRFMIYGNSDRKNIHPVVVVGFVIAIMLAPIVGNLMKLAISRKREYLADASGALLTRYPQALASALEKIAQYNKPMRKANHATAHLFIANPFNADRATKKGALAKLEEYLSTHPPIEKRIALLRKMAQQS